MKELRPVLYKQWKIRIRKEFNTFMDNNMWVYEYKTDPKNIEEGTLLYHHFAYPWLPIPYGKVKSKKEAIEYVKKLIDARKEGR